MKKILFILFAFSFASNEILNYMEVEDNSTFSINHDIIFFKTQFKNISDKKIKDFKYEINIYNENDSLIKNIIISKNSHNSNIIISKNSYNSYLNKFLASPITTIESGESYRDIKTFKPKDIFENYTAFNLNNYWSSIQNAKVKARVLEVTFLDDNIKNNKMELVSISGDIRYYGGVPKEVSNPITLWFYYAGLFIVGGLIAVTFGSAAG